MLCECFWHRSEKCKNKGFYKLGIYAFQLIKYLTQLTKNLFLEAAINVLQVVITAEIEVVIVAVVITVAVVIDVVIMVVIVAVVVHNSKSTLPP